ncbi:helix-turn-helix transcriptional regulator [Litoreibacter roseus]|uniref:helix-turn-helix transcriptional regulator n=1 Tax=Litoreibacter roseus TaxID=2601869 RepID=UPI001358D536|nr:hypothetical protein [Litoreibacter roseus]
MRNWTVQGIEEAIKVYEPKNPKLHDVLNEIEDSQTVNQLAGSFAAFPREFGLDFATLIVANEGDRALLQKRFLSSLPLRSKENCFVNDCLREDRILRDLSNKFDVFFYSARTIPDGGEASEVGSSNFAGFGGFAFRISHLSGRFGYMLFSSDRDVEWLQDVYRTHESDLHWMSMQFFDAFCYLARIGKPTGVELTDDEICFLRLLAISDDPNSAMLHRYTYGSAKTLKTSIARKLGVTSIFQAISIALKAGVISEARIVREETVMSQTDLIGFS